MNSTAFRPVLQPPAIPTASTAHPLITGTDADDDDLPPALRAPLKDGRRYVAITKGGVYFIFRGWARSGRWLLLQGATASGRAPSYERLLGGRADIRIDEISAVWLLPPKDRD